LFELFNVDQKENDAGKLSKAAPIRNGQTLFEESQAKRVNTGAKMVANSTAEPIR